MALIPVTGGHSLLNKGLDYYIVPRQDANPWPDDAEQCEQWRTQQPLTWNSVNMDLVGKVSVGSCNVFVRYYERYLNPSNPPIPSTYSGADDPLVDAPDGYQQVQKTGEIYVNYPKFRITAQTFVKKSPQQQVFRTNTGNEFILAIEYRRVPPKPPAKDPTFVPVPEDFGPFGGWTVCEIIESGGDPLADNAGFTPQTKFPDDSDRGVQTAIRQSTEYDYSRVFDQMVMDYYPRLSVQRQQPVKLVGAIPEDPYFPNGRIDPVTKRKIPPQFPLDAIVGLTPDPRPSVTMTYTLTTTYEVDGKEYTESVDVQQTATQTPEAFLGQKMNAMAQKTYRYHGYDHNGLYKYWEEPMYNWRGRLIDGKRLTEPRSVDDLTRDEYNYTSSDPYQPPISDGAEVRDADGNTWRYNNGEWSK